MSRFFTGLVATSVCCALLTGCGSEANSSMSITFCGRIESINEENITLQPGKWENEQFVPDESASTITLSRSSTQSDEGMDAAYADLRQGTVIRFTVSAEMDGGEKMIRLEILYQPDE